MAETGDLRVTEASASESTRSAQSRWWFVSTAVVVAMLGLVSTRIGPGDVGPNTAADLRGLLGAFSAISVMTLGLQLVLVGSFGDSDRPDRVLLPPRIGPVVAASVAAGVTAAMGAVLFIDSTVGFETRAAISVGLAVASLVASIPSRSVLLGGERWRDLALIALMSAAGRLVVTVWIPTDDVVTSVLAGLVVGEMLGAAGAIAYTRRVERSSTSWSALSRHLAVGSVASAGLMAVVILSSLSLSRFLGEQATVFNESAAVARLVFILIFTAAFVFFPAIARFPVGSVGLRRSFHGALILAVATGVIAGGAVAAFPTAFLDLVGAESSGVAAAETITTTRLLAIAFAGYGVAGVSLMQYIAHGSRFALCTWPFIGAMLVAHLASDSATTLAWCSLATSLALLTIASLPALLRVQPVLRPQLVDHVHSALLPRGSVAIVIPSYNPGPIVVETIDSVFRAFDRSGLDVHVVVVSDGSTDGSVALIDALDLSRLTHVVHATNRGKGAALRTGFALADTNRVGFVDADGDLDPSALVEMARIQTDTGAEIVFGSKRHSGSTVSVPLLRKVSSRSFALLIRLLFQLDIADTQTGIKLYTREVIARTLPVLEENGFALDLELFVAARAAGFHNFVEVPVDLVRKGGSTVSLGTVLKMLEQTLRIFWRAKITLQYLRAGHSTFAAQAAQQV